MSSFDKNNLALTSQGIAGQRTWSYTDTGIVADIQEVSGYFTSGYDCGMRRGDRLFFTEGDTGNPATTSSGKRQYGFTVMSASDTGTTQVTLGLGVLVGDTS